MKRKFLVLLSIVVILALACSSCEKLKDLLPDSSDLLGDDVCEHTYSDKWSTNATEHWHAATCEHAELKADVASHLDADENGKCDVCDYQIGHEHTYAEAWTSDETHHWKAATCSHSDQKGELAAHVDADANGSCDVCTAHVHVVNIYGKCTICDEQVSDPDITNLEIILPILVSNANKVVSGSIAYENLVTSVSDSSYIKSTELVEYKLGVGTAYYNLISTTISEGTDWEGKPYKNEYTDYLEKWYEADGEGAVGVYRYNYDGIPGEFVLDTVSPKEVLDGYYYSVSTLADGYGAEDILAVLYNLAKSDSASEFVSTYEDGVYTFSFNYLAVNSDTGEGEGNHVDYYEVSVSFTASDSGVLTSLDIECDCYTNSLANEADNDYTYDQNSNTITMKDTAVADTYTFVVSQTEGTRSYVPEYTKSDFVPEDFDVFVDEELTTELGATVTVTEGSTLFLYLGNFAPAGTSSSYIADTYICNLDVYTWIYDDSIGIYCQTAGEYSVEISLGGKTISFTLVVEAEQSGGGDVELGENEFTVTTTETYDMYMTDLYTFTATGAGTYTFTIPAGLGLWSEESQSNNPWGSPEVDYYANEFGATVSVELAEGEEYSYYVASTKKDTWTISYTYVAGDVSGGDEGDETVIKDANGLGGEYSIDWIMSGMFVLTFTPDSEGALTGTLEVVDNNKASNGGTFTYTIDNGAYLLFDSTNQITTAVIISNDGTNWNFQNASVLTPQVFATVSSAGGDGEEVTLAQGTYTGTDGFGNSFLTVVIDDTTVTFTFNHPMMGPSSVTATYAIVDGAVVLYDEDGEVLNPLAGALTIDANGVPTGADYNGTGYTLAASGSTGGGDVGGDDEDTEGTIDNPIVIESVPYTITLENGDDFYFTWTATEDCVLIIKNTISAIEGDYSEQSLRDDEYNLLYKVYYGIKAGDVLSINIWNSGETVEAVVETGTPVIEGSEDLPLEISIYSPNTATYPIDTDDGFVWFTYESYMDGTLTLSFASNVNVKYGSDVTDLVTVENTNEINIDIVYYGTYYILVSSVDGEEAEISFNASTEYKPGSPENPIKIENFEGDHTCDYSGDEVWYVFTPEEGGYVTLNTATAGVTILGGSSIYNMTEDENGSVTFYAKANSDAYICLISYDGVSGAEYSVTFVAGEHEEDGSYQYPYTIELGEANVTFPKSYTYVWFKVETTATGYIKLTVPAGISAAISSTPSSYSDDAVTGELSLEYAAPAGTYYVGLMLIDEEADLEATFNVVLEEGELQPNGSALLPYTAIVGENTCAYPGGPDLVWYKVEVDGACTITVSSDFVSDKEHTDWDHDPANGCAWLAVGSVADIYDYENVVSNTENIGSDVSYTAAEAGTYYLGVAVWCEVEGDIVFNVTVA